MPRTRARSRRRRQRNPTPPAPTTSDVPATDLAAANTQLTRVQRPWWRPSIGTLAALCLGIYLGTLAADIGTAAEVAATWIGVIGAGLGAGKLSRRWMIERRTRDR